MTDLGAGGIEIEDIRRFTADAPAVAVEFIGDTAAFVLAEEAVLLVSSSRQERKQKLHAGAILSSAADSKRLLTSGDDGQVVCIDANGTPETLFADERRRWVDHVAAGRDGSFAWSIGKQAFWRAADGTQAAIPVPSSVGGLAFTVDCSALAVAHYNGATVWRPQGESPPIELHGKGSHLQPSFSPDGAVLVTAMREPTLHAWSLANRSDLPMPSYPTRVCSMDWTADGRFLATSGSDRLALLSFQMSDNPLARMPLLLAPYSSVVTAVACHPAKNVVAAGYADGLVLLVRLPDGAEIVIKAPDDSPIAAMRWSRSATLLGIASENGQCRIVVIK